MSLLPGALAGSAAGLMGFGQWLIAAITAQAVGMSQNGTVWPTMAFVIGFTVLSCFSYLLARWGEARSLDSPVRARVDRLQPKKTRKVPP